MVLRLPPVVVLLGGALLGCNRTPTSPTPSSSRPTFTVVYPPPTAVRPSCDPQPGATIHTIALSGSATPLKMWVTLQPARGSTIRVGDWLTWTVSLDGPSGYMARIGTSVTTSRGLSTPVFSSVGYHITGPCGAIPRSSGGHLVTERPNGRLYLRYGVWIEAGTIFPSDPNAAGASARLHSRGTPGPGDFVINTLSAYRTWRFS